MSPDLDKKLVDSYPELFRDRNGDRSQTSMCYGFQCGDGWYKLIDDLCFCIQNHVDQSGAAQPHVRQVKEKFGMLRFYVSGGGDMVEGMVRMAELLSARTCEECGDKGEIRPGVHIQTLCQKHAELRDQEDAKQA